jgi:hypothetical protein
MELMAAAMDDEDSAHDYKRPFIVQAPIAAATRARLRCCRLLIHQFYRGRLGQYIYKHGGHGLLANPRASSASTICLRCRVPRRAADRA